MIPVWSAFAFAVGFAVPGRGVPVGGGSGRGGEGTRRRITPRRTIAVALVTLGAVVASFYGSLIAGQAPWYCCELSHSLWHPFWALLAVAIAFGLYRFRRAWAATGWTERCVAAAELLVRAMAVGNVLASVGAAIPYEPPGALWVWRLDYVLAQIFHTPGELLGVGSLLILLPVCLVMLGVGVRGALRPAAQPS